MEGSLHPSIPPSLQDKFPLINSYLIWTAHILVIFSDL